MEHDLSPLLRQQIEELFFQSFLELGVWTPGAWHYKSPPDCYLRQVINVSDFLNIT